MSQIMRRDKYFIESGKKWGSSIVNKVLSHKTDGFYSDIDKTLERVEKTCFDYGVGNKTTRKGKKLTDDDINFYQGAYLSISKNRFDIVKKYEDKKFEKKWGKYR